MSNLSQIATTGGSPTNAPTGGVSINTAFSGLCRVSNTSTGQSAAEVTASITPVTNFYDDDDIRRWGALGAGEDNTAHINNGLAVCKVHGRPLKLAGLKLVSSGGHTHDISLHGLDGQGATITFSGMASGGTAWTVVASVGGNTPYPIDPQHARNPIRYVYMLGTGIGTGIFFGQANIPGVAWLGIFACVFEYFATNVVFGNNAYIIHFYGCVSNNGTTGVSIPTGLTNSAETVEWHGGGIANSNTGINNLNSGTEFHLYGTSIDNNIVYFQLGGGSKTYTYGLHNEIINASTLSAAPFQLTGTNTRLVINGGVVFADGTGPFTYPATFSIGAGSLVQLEGGVELANLKNTANVLCTGAGSLIIGSPILQLALASNPTVIGTTSNFNFLRDGGFELASIADNIAIVSDTVSPPTSRLSGSNIQLAIESSVFRSGAQALGITKAGAAGTNAQFAVFIPCAAGQRFGVNGYLNVSANQTGNIFVVGGFADVVYGTNAVPLLLGGSTSGLTRTISAIQTGTWTQFNASDSTYVAPSWANFFLLTFNLTSVGAATYYLDDLVITAM